MTDKLREIVQHLEDVVNERLECDGGQSDVTLGFEDARALLTAIKSLFERNDEGLVDPLCAKCGCYRSAHGEGERCEPVGWTFTESNRPGGRP